MSSYLADENIPLETIKFLQKKKIDILSSRELRSGISDELVLRFAIQQKRVLITFDKDFGSLIFKQKPKRLKGLILLRFQPKSAAFVASQLVKLLKVKIAFKGHFTVMDNHKIRVMPLN